MSLSDCMLCCGVCAFRRPPERGHKWGGNSIWCFCGWRSMKWCFVDGGCGCGWGKHCLDIPFLSPNIVKGFNIFVFSPLFLYSLSASFSLALLPLSRSFLSLSQADDAPLCVYFVWKSYIFIIRFYSISCCCHFFLLPNIDFRDVTTMNITKRKTSLEEGDEAVDEKL